ncbi:MAG: hypothetical protein IPP77_04605 [Bacteroidetes bacterium]|nr:hypothetical protein [Bacteroidota bacterium]
MTKRRISHNITTFNSQIYSINSRLQSVSVAWGNQARYIYLKINAAQVAQIQSKANEWSTTLYPKYTDPLTKQLMDGADGPIKSFMKEFRKLVSPALDFIAASDLADHVDEKSFNLTLMRHRHKRTRRTIGIQADCMLAVTHHGTGSFRCHVRKPDSEGRARIPLEDGAREVEVAYYIVPKNEEAKKLANPDRLRTREKFTRALFNFHIGGEYSGYWVQIFARWFNIRYPHFAGAWSEGLILVIP